MSLINTIHRMMKNIVEETALTHNNHIFSSCSGRDFSTMVKLLEDRPEMINLTMGVKEDTLLHRAASLNRSEIVKLLIKSGAKQIKDRNGNLPLHVACVSAECPTIIPLIENTQELQIHNNDGDHPLHVAAAAGNMKAIKCLIKHGVDPHTVGLYGDTALHAAAQGGNIEMMKFLLDLNIQIDAINLKGETALHVAAGHFTPERGYDHVKLLLDHGAYIGTASNNGDSCLHKAAATGSPASFKYLLELGAPVTRFKQVNGTWKEETGGKPLLKCVLSSGCQARCKILLGAIMKARNALRRSLSVQNMCETGRKFIDNREITQQELRLAEMHRELLVNPYEEDSVMRTLIQNFPDAVSQLLDDCLVTNLKRIKVYDKVMFDFFIFDPDNEMAFLDLIVAAEKPMLLGHPVVETFVELKWWRTWKEYAFFLLFYLCHMASIFGYVYVRFGHKEHISEASQCIAEEDSGFKQLHTGAIQACAKTLSKLYQSHHPNHSSLHNESLPVKPVEDEVDMQLEVWWFILLILNSILVFFIYINIFSYACYQHIIRKSAKSLGRLCAGRMDVMSRAFLIKELFTPILCFVLLFLEIEELAAFLLMISAYEFTILLTRVPRVGLHVFLTNKVFWTILEFFLCYVIQIFAFAMAFHILMPEDSVFSHLPDSFLKILTMLLGEFDFSDTAQSPKTGWAVRLLFMFFLVTMSIVLMNLVVGLAISDIDAMRKDADIHKLISSLVAIRHMEAISKGVHRLLRLRQRRFCSTVTTCRSTDFNERVCLDLKDLDYARSCEIQITCRGKRGDLTTSYTCSSRIVKKVTDIVKERWSRDRMGRCTSIDTLAAKVDGLEKKLDEILHAIKLYDL